MTVIALTYRGNGAFRPNLPARDLDRSDLDALAATSKRSVEDIVGEAIGSGLYLAITEADEGSTRNAPAADEAGTPPTDPLEDPATTRPMLVAIAEGLDLVVASRDTKANIIAAITAERQRLADEAEASDSGEGDQGGDSTPADDSGAPAADEAGTPPTETPGA